MAPVRGRHVVQPLTHQRLYRAAISELESLEIMRHGAGKDFDPRLLALFFQNLPTARRIAALHPDEPRAGAEPGLNCLPGELATLAEVATG